jgi:molybdopterin/thiamine biosynthesis adenylyltransferase
VLLIGLGGLGCPAALALVRSGVGVLQLCDDDRVDEANLHRQILYQGSDVGRDKLGAAERALGPDACHLERRPVVHGAGLRWAGTVWSVAPAGRPCYRCLFEDVPAQAQANCDAVGVMGPVVGILGACMAELGLRSLSAGGQRNELWTLDGKSDTLRSVPVAARPGCPLCGSQPTIHEIEEARYVAGVAAA